MPQPTTGRHTPLLRVLGFVVAAGLGVVGVWLIVTGNSSKNVRIGAIAAFWGLLIGTYAVFGSRLPSRPADPAPAAPQPQPPPVPTRELDVRLINEIERSALTAARREFAQELQLMLRRETQASFAQELSGLRAEVTALRKELVEKVGGQLRLERIETTRLIGSDLEALQSELRKLRESAREPGSGAQPPRLPAAIPLVPHAEIHEAEIVSDGVQVTAPVGPHLIEPMPRAADPPKAPQSPPPAPPVGPRPVPPPPPPPVYPSAAAPSAAAPPAAAAKPAKPPADVRPAARPEPTSSDPFASMPRITPFTDFALDPIAPQTEPESSGVRRHRAEDADNDTLARILAREQR
ncbi:MAG TPA: hypothetical protein VGH43_11640 [Jatrophihabitans sp.]